MTEKSKEKKREKKEKSPNQSTPILFLPFPSRRLIFKLGGVKQVWLRGWKPIGGIVKVPGCFKLLQASRLDITSQHSEETGRC